MKPIDEIMAALSTAQKTDLLAGENGWCTHAVPEAGVPSVLMTDGPHGLRKQKEEDLTTFENAVPATCFPAAATLSCSFDPQLVREIARAIAEEARDQGVQMVLGPGINIKRSPLCGRNFEYYSEDPLLAGRFGAAFIEGLQSVGVGACIKHFACNSREYFRMVTSSQVDSRALHEIYLRGFEYAVRTARPYAVMSAYNLINNHYCGEWEYLIKDTLRTDWGFQGIVVSDWGAVYSRVAGVRAGQDLEMPYSGREHADAVRRALRNGSLSQEEVDSCVRRVLEFVARCEKGSEVPYSCSYGSHHDTARKAARESAVLLRNENNVLPLAKEQKIALIGAFAVQPRYQGAGSSLINPVHLENAYETFPKYGLPFTYAQGYGLASTEPRTAKDLREEAVRAAGQTGTAVIIAGLPASMEYEGVDRENMDLPDDQNALISAVAAVAKTVVVLCCGAPVTMPWLSEVDSVLHCYLGGEAGASAMAELLTGDANPGGRLAETYPLKLEDTPAHLFFRDGRHNMEYRESIYVGYRYYEAVKKDVLFPFGYGLSYTTFEWHDFSFENTDGTFRAAVTVKNTGKRAGADVVQVYARGLSRLYPQLAGFSKVYLESGEEQRISIPLDTRSFSYYEDGWHTETSDVFFARNVAEPVYQDRITFADSHPAPSYPAAPDGRWDRRLFTSLFKEAPELFIVAHPFTLNATLADLRSAPAGDAINNLVTKYGSRMLAADDPPEIKQIMAKYLEQNPMRALVSLSGGAFSYGMASALLMMANGNYLLGVARLGLELRRLKKRSRPRVQEPL